MPKLRYSDRERAANDTLDPLEFAVAPKTLRFALVNIYETAARTKPAGVHFDGLVCAAMAQHFAKQFYGVHSDGTARVAYWLRNTADVADVLDTVEILAEEGPKQWAFAGKGTHVADASIEDRINAAFIRHRFGYRLSNGEVRRVGSPALDVEITGPALLVAGRPGWEEVDRTYRAALHHRRGGPEERDAAITDAHAALEAAMKAAGLKGDRLSALAKSFRNSGIVLPQLEGVPDALDMLLKRSSSIRDSLGDAHGKAPGAEPVPDGVVDLAIYWTGAFINYLSEASA